MKIIKLKIIVLLTGLLMTTQTFSQPVHTWHTIFAEESVWNGNLQALNQASQFVDQKGSLFNHFTLDKNNPITFGAIFSPEDDFDVAYTLTLIAKTPVAFSSKACVFIVTALGPAQPDIKSISYHGARCEAIRVPGVGENFYVA